MKLLSILIITFLQITRLAWAQTDTIPKKNTERKFHAGIFYSVGLSTLYIPNENGLVAEANIGLYKNWGLLVETKIYKNFWLELNANRILGREGQIHLTKDTLDIDVQIRDGLENTVLLYLKYKVLQKKKINVMAKLGLGFGTIFSKISVKNNRTKQTEYYSRPGSISNLNYYSFSLGVDANYQINKHIILFNQLTYNFGTNALKKYSLYVSTDDTYEAIVLENLIPHTLIYSLGIKL